MSRIAIKRLTASDLTLFEWHFKNQEVGGNQKAINLNADVFIDQLYPQLPALAYPMGGLISLDLSIYGPGLRGEYNLQRKIKKFGHYKNWRLDGEYVSNPHDDQTRFNILDPGDLVVLAFVGEPLPTAARAIFVARAEPADASLHAGLSPLVAGQHSMVSLSPIEFERLLGSVELPREHPVLQLAVDADIEDAVLGGGTGPRRLRRRSTKITRAELEDAKRRASEIGRAGEEAVAAYLAQLLTAGSIEGYDWISDVDPLAPWDFEIAFEGNVNYVDVKTTYGEFVRPLHISIAELEWMAQQDRYFIYRVSDFDGEGALLHTSESLKPFAEAVLRDIVGLQQGIFVDSFSVAPTALRWSGRTRIPVPVHLMPTPF